MIKPTAQAPASAAATAEVLNPAGSASNSRHIIATSREVDAKKTAAAAKASISLGTRRRCTGRCRPAARAVADTDSHGPMDQPNKRLTANG
jgi:hypothetical protein